MIITRVILSSRANRCSHVHVDYEYWGRNHNTMVMGTWRGCVRGNERKRMHDGTRKDAEMSWEPRAQTQSDGRRHPITAAALKNVQSWSKCHISPVFVGCFNQLTYVQDKDWICLEQRRVELPGRMPFNCLCVTRFGHVCANRFMTAMESVCLIHHCQSSSPLQCQLI